MQFNEDEVIYPPEFIELLNSITSKRPATVIKHIREHGFITTQELKDTYGYNHPPRAVRDVREQGIPIETFRIEGNDGRKIAAYKFGDPTEVNRAAKTKGRQTIDKTIKESLIKRHGARDFIYLEEVAEKDLQVDHRVPYEIGGEGNSGSPEDFMLLSASANRLKSHACETCLNWNVKDAEMCKTCFWAYPENYKHVAGRPERLAMFSIKDGKAIESHDSIVETKGRENLDTQLREVVEYFLVHLDEE